MTEPRDDTERQRLADLVGDFLHDPDLLYEVFEGIEAEAEATTRDDDHPVRLAARRALSLMDTFAAHRKEIQAIPDEVLGYGVGRDGPVHVDVSGLRASLESKIEVDRQEEAERLERAERGRQRWFEATVEADPNDAKKRHRTTEPTDLRDRAPKALIGPVRVVGGDGKEDWRQLGRDAATVRVFLTQRCDELGLDFDRVTVRFRPGPHIAGDAPRYAILAALAAEAKDRGATLAAIGEAIGMPKQRASELVKAAQQAAA